ncbi:MAG: hypothetical protein HOP12_01245 [Candidatus Eisenbacteria bacterium]|uniref:Uncharacterized protein n=1 Tax=Eiseniibacteriota bacterium TaxID=2212470 RepID=A0A849SBN2_UNCEI|nr:hypothetical protein [Candidatus Eisenbacteria bacterium]
MKSRYAVTWARIDGTQVPIEELPLEELRDARLALMREDLEDAMTMSLFDAISAELARQTSPNGKHPRDAWPMAA